MKYRIPASVASSRDLKDLILEIREYASWYEHESVKKRMDVEHISEQPTLSPSAIELIHEWSASKSISMQSLDNLIKALQEYVDTAPTITLTLAAPPTGTVKANLVNWCRENIAPNILVTFKFNATILGGMVVHYGSRVFDWSFRRQLLASRQKFPEVLRRV